MSIYILIIIYLLLNRLNRQFCADQSNNPITEVVAPTPVVIDPRSVKTLNTIQSQLRDAQSNGGSSQATLYSHLTEVFNRCIQNHPTDAFDKFEDVSGLIKKT